MRDACWEDDFEEIYEPEDGPFYVEDYSEDLDAAQPEPRPASEEQWVLRDIEPGRGPGNRISQIRPASDVPQGLLTTDREGRSLRTINSSRGFTIYTIC